MAVRRLTVQRFVHLDTLAWLAVAYGDRGFHIERDIVYTLQRQLFERFKDLDDGWRAYDDYPMLPGPRRNPSAELVILARDAHVAVATEFRYEPCHTRHDILTG